MTKIEDPEPQAKPAKPMEGREILKDLLKEGRGLAGLGAAAALIWGIYFAILLAGLYLLVKIVKWFWYL